MRPEKKYTLTNGKSYTVSELSQLTGSRPATLWHRLRKTLNADIILNNKKPPIDRTDRGFYASERDKRLKIKYALKYPLTQSSNIDDNWIFM